MRPLCGKVGIWWEDVLQTAKALGTEQGRPDAPPSDIAAKFLNLTLKEDGSVASGFDCPTLLFWRKGSRLSRPEAVTGLRDNNAFQDWLWERLKASGDSDRA